MANKCDWLIEKITQSITPTQTVDDPAMLIVCLNFKLLCGKKQAIWDASSAAMRLRSDEQYCADQCCALCIRLEQSHGLVKVYTLAIYILWPSAAYRLSFSLLCRLSADVATCARHSERMFLRNDAIACIMQMSVVMEILCATDWPPTAGDRSGGYFGYG